MISNNSYIIHVYILIPLVLFPHILHNQALSLLRSILPPTWTLDMSLFKASEFGGAVDSHRFGLFFFGTINTKWKLYSELINGFIAQP